MQPAHQAASSALSSRSSKPSSIAAPKSPMTSRPLPRDLLDFVWLRMAARYGHAWVSQYGPAPDGPVGAEWRETLGALTREQVDEGFRADAARGAEWPPSSAAFRRDCLGVPTLAKVRDELRPGHPAPSRFARAVWQRIDGWSYQRADADKADRMVREAYELTVEAVMRGEPLPPEPVGALEHDVDEQQRTCTPEVGRAALDAIDRATRGMEA